MHAWLHDLQHLLGHGDAVVLVTVARVRRLSAARSGRKDAGRARGRAPHHRRRTSGMEGDRNRATGIERRRAQSAHAAARAFRAWREPRPVLRRRGRAGVRAARYKRSWLGHNVNKRMTQGQSTVRSVGFGPSPDSVIFPTRNRASPAPIACFGTARVSTKTARC